MSQIDELQTRITAALERIGRSAEARVDAAERKTAEAASLAEDLDGARQALEDEKTVTAQYEERVKALRARLEAREAELAAARDEGAGALSRLDTDLQALRAANAQLRESNAALRAAHAQGLADPGLIDAGVQAELEALRADRAAERDEVALVLAEIDRAVAGSARDAADQPDHTEEA